MSRTDAGLPSERDRVRMARLPQLRHWVVLPPVFAALIVGAGLALRSPALSAADLSVDVQLSYDHWAPLTGIALFLNAVFSPAGGLMMITGLCLFLLFVRRSPINAVATGVVAIAGWVSSELFKILVGRQRPAPSALFDPLVSETGTDSFPSGHTALAAALATAVFLLARGTRWQWPALLTGGAVAVVVALSRVYLGVHYPTDVFASFLTSLTGASFMTGIWNAYGIRVLARIPVLSRLGPVHAPVPDD